MLNDVPEMEDMNTRYYEGINRRKLELTSNSNTIGIIMNKSVVSTNSEIGRSQFLSVQLSVLLERHIFEDSLGNELNKVLKEVVDKGIHFLFLYQCVISTISNHVF